MTINHFGECIFCRTSENATNKAQDVIRQMVMMMKNVHHVADNLGIIDQFQEMCLFIL
jgi:microsomal dipeptidase-like Zn-dependent dipeptidase